MQQQRQGAKGALLDEYQRAFSDLKSTIAVISAQELTTIADPATSDPDCHSIQTVLTHVVRSGIGYATYMRQHQGEAIEFPTSETFDSVEAYALALDAAFLFTEKTFEAYPGLPLETSDPAQKILARWGQLYDVEQLMEHAIVHVLRHRRQIEGFIKKMRQ